MSRETRPAIRVRGWLRAGAVIAGVTLLVLPRGEWPALHDVAWRATAWLDATRSERGPIPAEARATLLRSQRLQGIAGREALSDWQRHAALSLRRALPVRLPYAESLSLVGDELALAEAGAQTYTVTVPADERLRILTRAAEGARGGVIVDVFEPDTTAERAPTLIGSFGPQPLEQRVVLPPRRVADAGEFEPGSAPRPASSSTSLPAPRDDVLRTLHVRVQPTPAALGRFAVRLDTQPAFGFPVDTDAASPVRSRFGVARDGGRRSHHGIDIFADRGTDVLAAADGVVVRTGESPRGGLHVWQRGIDERGERIGSLYYAHLERIDVQPGTVVLRGDRLGTVGNTGNARTTPPHLHFGLYRRFAGPVDPLPLTGEARRATPDVVIEAALPRWLQVLPRQANLRGSPDTARRPLATLAAGELVRVDGILPGGRWLRIGTAAHGGGWIARSLLGTPAPGEALAVQGPLRATLEPGAPVLAELSAGSGAVPLGRFGNALRVRTADGLTGWLPVREPSS